MRLYEIPEELENLLSQEEIDFDAVSTLSKTETEKLESIGVWIKNLEANAAAMSAEVKTLQDRIKSAQNKSENLKKYISSYLLSNDRKMFETSKIKLSFRRSEVVEIYSDENIPDEYKIFKTDIRVDKTVLKKALQDGSIFEGVELIEKQNLQIK